MNVRRRAPASRSQLGIALVAGSAHGGEHFGPQDPALGHVQRDIDRAF